MVCKKHIVIFGFLLLCFQMRAQSLKPINKLTRQPITDTIRLQSADNGGWVGAESLDLYIILENKNTKTLEVGVRKIQHEYIQNDVEHTICFANQCYDSATYESPFHAFIAAGSSDSSFVAHYLFDNRYHIRGINHIAYQFYDVNNTNDQTTVEVIYNTVIATGMSESLQNQIQVSPNPAHESLYISGLSAQKQMVKIYNMMGEIIYSQLTQQEATHISMMNFPKGVYTLVIGNSCKKIVLQ